MSSQRLHPWARAAVVTLLLVTASACTVMDVHTHDQPAGLHSTGLIHGIATVGFAPDPPILNIEVFDGRSPGAFFLLDIWHLLRLELGIAGATVGVGPLDLGLGILAYRPVPPGAYPVYHDSIWAPPPHVHPPGPVYVPGPPPLPPPPVHVHVPEPYCPPVVVPHVHHPPGVRVPIYVPRQR